MIVGFANPGTEDIWNGQDTKDARRTLEKSLWPIARRKLDMLNAAVTLLDLRSPPGNRLEALKGDRSGTCSIRINDQFRLTFSFASGNAHDVAIVDYH